MKYLVSRSKKSIEFFPFDAPGDYTIFTSEKSSKSYYVREHVSEQSGLITVNAVNCYPKEKTIFILTHSGCNIRVDDELIPQGVTEMEMDKKYVASKMTLFFIDEEERSELQSEFDEEREQAYYNQHPHDDDDNYNNIANDSNPWDQGYDDEDDWEGWY